MSEALIGGEILTSENDKDQNFNGTVNITIFDKPITVTTLGNEGAQPFKYETFQNKIFIGQAAITNGEFETSFLSPRTSVTMLLMPGPVTMASPRKGKKHLERSTPLKSAGLQTIPQRIKQVLPSPSG